LRAPAGSAQWIRWLIGPECCVTGSEHALELDGVGPGRLRDRRATDLLPPAHRAPGNGRSPQRAPKTGQGGGGGAGRRPLATGAHPICCRLRNGLHAPGNGPRAVGAGTRRAPVTGADAAAFASAA